MMESSRKKVKEPGFELMVTLILLVALVATIIPVWYALAVSVTPLGKTPGLFTPPWEWSASAYAQLTSNTRFLQAFVNSVLITVGGVAISLVLTVLTAYPLSRSTLPGRNIFMTILLLAFLFGAGMIPTYLLVKDLNLLNTWWAIWLPTAISVYNTFVMKAFFQAIPTSLFDAAEIDGASEWQILTRILLPLSTPILLTIGLFYAVYYWNEFFNPILYLNKQELMPLPVLLRDILIGASGSDFTEGSFFSNTTFDALKMAAVFLSMIPMLLVYPWIQRYFTRGVLLGSVKE
jgi:putative aldouronate transport system permease protein